MTLLLSRIATLLAPIQGFTLMMFAVIVVLQVISGLSGPVPNVNAAGMGADLARILRSFSIRQGQIIQPSESQANGARYLNDTVIATNEDCLIWCWETTHCNVAIFGTVTMQRAEVSHGRDVVSRKCYLFDCGPGNRQCSFVDNENYITSCLIHGSPLHTTSHGQLQGEQPMINQRGARLHQLVGGDSSNPQGRDKSQAQGMNNNNINNNGLVAADKSSGILVSRGGNHMELNGCFRCIDNSACISMRKVCDGRFDCRDRSDEATCQPNNNSNRNHVRYRGGEPENEPAYVMDSSARLKTIHRRPDQTDNKLKGRPRFNTPEIDQEEIQHQASQGQSQPKSPNAKESSIGKVKKPDRNNVQEHERDSPSMSISFTQVDSGEKHASTTEVQSGAILAIALGLCVTALLLVLVGCKLRLVRRRLVNWRRENRKGLSLLADDDDEDEDEDVVHGII